MLEVKQFPDFTHVFKGILSTVVKNIRKHGWSMQQFLFSRFCVFIPRFEAKKMALEKKALGGKPRSTIPQKDLGSPMNVFKGYDLQELNIPLECRPGEQGSYQGRHGYTVASTNGSVP